MNDSRPFGFRMTVLVLLVVTTTAMPLLAGRRPTLDPVVAFVGEERITRDALEAEMAQRPRQCATPEQRRELLDEMIEVEALVARARQEGYDRDPEVIELYKKILVARYKRDTLDRRLSEIAVADHEIESFYERHKYDYARPERYRAAVVFIRLPADAAEDQREAARRKAERALGETLELDPSTPHFGAVAARYSDDRASRYRGGVIGWITRDPLHKYAWAPEVVDAVLSLGDPGDLAPIVQADDGLYLVRLVDREQSEIRSLDTLRDGFRNQILRQKQERVYREFMEQVRSHQDIRVDETVLESVALPEATSTEKRPPALPGG